MRSYVVAPIVAIALTVFLGYRQASLERRVAELTIKLGVSNADDARGSSAVPVDSARAPTGDKSHEARLRALATALESLRADVNSLEQATADMPQGMPVSDQQILSVVKEQGAKVMETQLKYHRERWLDLREAGLADFSRRAGLNQQQSDHVWGLLSSEIDKMVEILRKPESFENPERAATEWKQVLLDTDRGVHKVLEPDKAVAWDQARFLERKTLWPWLPD